MSSRTVGAAPVASGGVAVVAAAGVMAAIIAVCVVGRNITS